MPFFPALKPAAILSSATFILRAVPTDDCKYAHYWLRTPVFRCWDKVELFCYWFGPSCLMMGLNWRMMTLVSRDPSNREKRKQKQAQRKGRMRRIRSTGDFREEKKTKEEVKRKRDRERGGGRHDRKGREIYVSLSNEMNARRERH